MSNRSQLSINLNDSELIISDVICKKIPLTLRALTDFF